MSEERNTKQGGLINSIFGFVINTLFLLIISLLVSIFIEFGGMYLGYWSFDSSHSFDMLNIELSYANYDIKDAILNKNTVGWVSTSILFLSVYILKFYELIAELFMLMPFDVVGLDENIKTSYNISMVFILRLFLILLSFPLFLMVFIWAFVDGLVERDLRRFGAGRESSTIFDGVRRLTFPCLILPFLVYLSFPISINPLFIIVPSALFQALLFRVMFSKYKKYL